MRLADDVKLMYFFDVSPRKCDVWLLFTGDHLLIAVQKQDGEVESGTQFPTRRLVRVSPPSSLQHLFQLPSYVTDSSEFPLFDSSSRVSADSYLLTFDLLPEGQDWHVPFSPSVFLPTWATHS